MFSQNVWVLIPVLALSIPIVAIIGGVISDIVKSRQRIQPSAISDDEREQLQKLAKSAESMAERIATLESILDAEVPDWREDHERH